jgi:hypothetical protein
LITVLPTDFFVVAVTDFFVVSFFNFLPQLLLRRSVSRRARVLPLPLARALR